MFVRISAVSLNQCGFEVKRINKIDDGIEFEVDPAGPECEVLSGEFTNGMTEQMEGELTQVVFDRYYQLRLMDAIGTGHRSMSERGKKRTGARAA